MQLNFVTRFMDSEGKEAHTAIGETKFDTQIATCESETLHQVFSGLRKSYDSIYVHK